MAAHQHGTDANEITKYFVRVASVYASKATMQKSNILARRLLNKYTKDEVIAVIDHLIDGGAKFQSLGYVEVVIGNVIAEIRQKAVSNQIKQEFAAHAKEQQTEVFGSDESYLERNRRRVSQSSVQSRFGKKYNFDLFERTGETD